MEASVLPPAGSKASSLLSLLDNCLLSLLFGLLVDTCLPLVEFSVDFLEGADGSVDPCVSFDFSETQSVCRVEL